MSRFFPARVAISARRSCWEDPSEGAKRCGQAVDSRLVSETQSAAREVCRAWPHAVSAVRAGRPSQSHQHRHRLLRKYTIEFSSRRVRVSFELHDRRPIVAAIERGVLDPSAETVVVPQFSPDLYAKMAGVCIYKTGRQTATVTVTVNKPNASFAHLPRLLNYPTEGRSGCCVRVTGYVGRVISMQIDRDLGEHLKRSPSSPDKLSLNRKLLQHK